MTLQSIQQLQQFIDDNKLRREDGIILFECTSTFHNLNTTSDFYTEVQVITLPEEMVLYILEWGTELHPENEMYRTSQYHFTCLGSEELEITGPQSDTRLVLSLNKISNRQ